MQNLYREVNHLLTSWSPTPVQGHAAKRLNNLSGFICGMIRKGKPHLSDIGKGLPQDIDSESKTASAKRFVSNKWVDYQTHYLPYLSSFLVGLLAITRLDTGIVLILDGSQIGKHNACLMVSLAWRKRSIPLYWWVKTGSKGHFSAQNHVDVLREALAIIISILPDGLPICILGDGEFDSIDLQKLCMQKGCEYVLRTAANTVLFQAEERFYAKQITPYSGHDCALMAGLEFTEKRFRYVNLVCWHDPKHEKPIFLIINLEEAREIIDYYDLRYAIECLFKDIKSSSFNLHKTRLKNAQEVSNLIIIAALAFLILAAFAVQYDQQKWRKKVHRVRKDQKVCSFLFFAILLIREFIEWQTEFNISFDLAKYAHKTYHNHL